MTQAAMPGGDPSASAAIAFGLFARLFLRELDAMARESLLAGEGAALLVAIERDSRAEGAAGALAGALAAATLDQLSADFARLFLGAGGEPLAPPLASVHLDGKGRLRQDASVRAQDLLRRHGLRQSDGVGEDADHVSVLLALCARLHADGNDGELAGVLDALILPWLPAFAADLTRFDQSGVYAAAGTLLLSYATELRARLGTAPPARRDSPPPAGPLPQL